MKAKVSLHHPDGSKLVVSSVVSGVMVNFFAIVYNKPHVEYQVRTNWTAADGFKIAIWSQKV